MTSPTHKLLVSGKEKKMGNSMHLLTLVVTFVAINVHITYCMNNHMQIFTPDGHFIRSLNMPKSLEQLAGIAIDSNDTVLC